MRILLLLLLCSTLALGQQKYKIFEQIDVNQGLSSNWVRDLVQDNKGYIWMATSDGLNRYDGYTIKTYNHKDEDPASLPINNFHCLFVDVENLIWLGYNGGISKYDPIKDGFVHFTHNPNNANSISSNKVSDITSDSEGNLWISTRDNGLCQLDKSTYNFKSYKDKSNQENNSQFILRCDKKDRIWIGTYVNGIVLFDIATKTFKSMKNGLTDPVISTLFESKNGTIWVGTGRSGLYYFDEKSQQFIQQKNIPSNQRILALDEDVDGNIWVSSENTGLFIIDKKTGETSNIKYNKYIANGIGHNSVNTILRDKNNNMWLGTFSSGVNLYKVPNNKFGHIFNDPINSNTLSHNAVLCFTEDSDKNLWIGTDDGGLNKYNPKTEKFEFYLKKSATGSLTTNVILSLKEDRNKNLWVGTYAEGLFMRDKATGKFVNKIPNTSFGSIVEDEEGYLWLGNWGQGLYRYNPKDGSYRIYSVNELSFSSISDDFIFYVYQDKNKKIWACTSLGLNLLEDPETGKFRRFLKDKGNPKSIAGNTIYHCYEDSKNRFWVGTDAGLSLLNRDSLKFVSYREADGLANANVTGILEDNEGNLWLSTNKGLSKFNPETKTFKNYNKSDGLQNNQFNIKAQYKLSSGELLYGGTNGYNRFNPKDITENKVPPVVLIKKVVAYENTTDTDLTNKKEVLHPTEEITLAYKQSNINFDFVAFNYANTQKVKYAYKLEGFDNGWKYTTNLSTISYTNLNPGSYKFIVKATNEDGLWNEEGASIGIYIESPIWYSKWFMALIAVVVLYLGLLGYKKYIKK